MFCTNCGNKLPDNAKFCPSCGAPVPANRTEEVLQAAAGTAEAVPAVAEAAAETLQSEAENVTEKAAETVGEIIGTADAVTEEAADTVAEAAEEAVSEVTEAAEETVSEVTEAAEDAVSEVTEAAEEAVSEVTEAVDEIVSEAAGAVEETAGEAVSEVLDSAENVTEEVTDAVSEAVGTAEEAVSETIQETAEAAEELTDAVSGTEEAATEALREISETAEAAADQIPEEIAASAEEAGSVPAFDGIPQEVPAEETAPAEPVSAPVMPPVQPQEPAPFSPYVQSGSGPAAPEAPVSPYTAETAPAQTEKSGGKKKGKGILAALLAVVLIAGLFFVYWNLPNTKFGRYTKQAAEAYSAGDYEGAADLYSKALEIHPDDVDAQNAMVELYNEVQSGAIESLENGLYEDAIAGVHLMEKISPDDTDNNEYAMFDIFYTWIYDEADKGNFDALQSILDRAETELAPEYSEELNIEVGNIREMISLEEQFRTAAVSVLDLHKNKNFKGVYDQLEGIIDSMKRYADLGGELPFTVTGSDSSGIQFSYDSGRDAAQVYIGNLIDGYLRSGYGEVYYIGYLSSAPSYEYFSAEEWFAGRPAGKFTEITFNDAPGTPTDDNCAEVTGVLRDGVYDGDIVNRRSGGKKYNMKFDYGKVVVLDTIDPNGDPGNVVGYTDDGNSWITFKDSGLTGSYGVRYIP